MSVVVDLIEDVVGGAVEAVGDVVEFAGDVLGDAVEAVDKYVIQPILDDPLTAIATAAAYMYGIPLTGIQGGAVAAGLANTGAGLLQGEEFDEAVKGGVVAGVTIAGTEAIGNYFSGAEGAAGAGVEGGFGGEFAPEVGVDIDAFGNVIEPMSYSSIPGPETALADFSSGAGSFAVPGGIDQYVPADYSLLPGTPDAAMPVNARLPGGSYLENAGGLDYGSGLNINQTASTGLNVPGVTTGMTPSVATPGVEPLNIQDVWNQGVAQIAPGDGLSGLDASLDVLPRDYMTGEIDFSKAYDLGYGTEAPYTPGISDYGGPPIEVTPEGVEIVNRDFAYEPGKEFSLGDTLSSIGDVAMETGKAGISFAMDNPMLTLGALTLATMPGMPQPPQRGAGESDADFAARMAEFETKLKLYNYERSRQDPVGDITQYGYGPQQRFFSDSQFVPVEPIEGMEAGGSVGNPFAEIKRNDELAQDRFVGDVNRHLGELIALYKIGDPRVRAKDLLPYFPGYSEYDIANMFGTTTESASPLMSEKIRPFTPEMIEGVQKRGEAVQSDFDRMVREGRLLDPMNPKKTMELAMGGLIGDNMPDYYQYGQQPMQQMQRPLGMAAGGQMIRSPLAMGGVTDGRSDDVPAVLSDGEYVFDAETVALLGNGSSEAGAALLDRMRQDIRKHKGENLARGEISPDAKNPLAYLRG